MHASIRRYKVESKSMGEVFRQANDGFVPTISKVPGFVGYYGLDTGNGELVTISLFKDQAGTKESERAAAEWVSKNVSHLIQTPPQITTGEVGMHKTN
jgi:hypothetical protein